MLARGLCSLRYKDGNTKYLPISLALYDTLVKYLETFKMQRGNREIIYYSLNLHNSMAVPGLPIYLPCCLFISIILKLLLVMKQENKVKDTGIYFILGA